MNRKLKLWELNRLTNEEFKHQEKFPIIVVLDNIRSLNNIGSFFRTSDAFNVQKIYLCGITAQPPHREIQKTALGATESVEWEYVEDVLSLIDDLKKSNVVICPVEQAEKTTLLQEVKINPELTYALIFGNEVEGVNQQIIDKSDLILTTIQFRLHIKSS